MSKHSNEILLALAYVSQITDPDSVRSRFIESLNALDDAFAFKFVDRLPPGLPENRSLPIATLRSSFGFAVMAEGSEASEIERAVFRNAFQFLAVILENRLQASALESKNESLLKEINHEKSLVRTVLDTLPVGVWVADGKGTILMGNAAGEKIWAGIRNIGIDQYSQYKAWWSDTGERIESEEWALARAIKIGETSINEEIDIECFDGTHKTILNSAAPLLDDERRMIGAVGINQDITERKQSENELKQNESRYRLLADNINDVIFVLDMNLNYTYVSPSIKILRGYEPDEVLRKQPAEMLTPSSLDLAMSTLSEILELDKSARRELSISRTLQLEMKRKDGTTVWTEVNFSFIRDENNRSVGILGVARNITERRKAEKELIESKMLLDSVFNASQDLILVIDRDLRVLMSNWKSPVYAGHTEFPINSHCFEAFIKRDTPCEPCHALGIFNTAKPVLVEYYNQYTERYKEVSAYPIFDDNNDVIMVAEQVRDITNRKRSEEQLLNYLYFMEASGQGLGMATLDGAMTYVNPTLCRLIGEERPEDVYKKKFSLYYPQEIRERLEKEIMPAVMSKGQWVGELALISTDGKYTPTIENVFLIRDKAGNPLCLADVITDITERKQAEEHLKEALEKLRKSLIGTIQAMSLMVETRDPYTAGHQRRVSNLARAIAQEMGSPKDTIDTVRMAGAIHDIGKISVPSQILSKPGKMTNIEMSLIKVHPQTGYDILKDVELPYPMAEIVLQHHERLDGSGYPQGLKDGQILIEAQIITVADVVEAMASHRPYRPALGIDTALEEIEKGKGVSYDSGAVDACLRLFRENGYSLD